MSQQIVEQQYGVSSWLCDFILRHQITETKPEQIVDFGAGGGKCGRIAREVLGKDVKLIAVEGYKKTADMLSEQGLYDEVHCSLIQNWVKTNIVSYDLAIFGDVLEHLTSEEIHKVISQCMNVFKRILIVCPLHNIFQEAEYGNILEVHRTYITRHFFDRYNPNEVHIIRRKNQTIMNVSILPSSESKPLYRKLSLFVFDKCMLILQPIGLARPFVNLLKRTVMRYKWLLKD